MCTLLQFLKTVRKLRSSGVYYVPYLYRVYATESTLKTGT